MRNQRCRSDQRLRFRYIDSTFAPLPKSEFSSPEFSSVACVCVARFLLDLFGNPEIRLSRDAAQLINRNTVLQE